jgi:hypothetical protein
VPCWFCNRELEEMKYRSRERCGFSAASKTP